MIRMKGTLQQKLSQMLTMILLSLGGECQKKLSWVLSYQEWQSYISSGQNNHDGEIEASAVGNKEVESEEEESNSSSEDSDESIKSIDDDDNQERRSK